MPLIRLIIPKLQADFPLLKFVAGNEFRWLPEEQTVFYNTESDDSSSLLHELAHGLLGHTTYARDIELLEIERAAWDYARQHIAPWYSITIEPDLIEDALDTYRDWLHARSACPHCKATGMQIKDTLYKCLACKTRWKVNDARMCALRRYIQK